MMNHVHADNAREILIFEHTAFIIGYGYIFPRLRCIAIVLRDSQLQVSITRALDRLISVGNLAPLFI